MSDSILLTTLLVLPWLGAVACLLLPGARWSVWVVRAAGGALLFLSMYGWWRCGTPEGQTVGSLPALDDLLGPVLAVDALGWLYLVAVSLTGLVGVVAATQERPSESGEAVRVLVLLGSLVGVILSADLILWLVFWMIPVLLACFPRRAAVPSVRRAVRIGFFLQLAGGLAALSAVGVLVAHMDRREAPGLLGLLPGDGGAELSLATGWAIAVLLVVAFLIRMSGWWGRWLHNPESCACPSTRILLQVGGLAAGLWGIQRVLLPMFGVEFGGLSWVLSGLALAVIGWGAWQARRGGRTGERPSSMAVTAAMAVLGVSLCNEEGWLGAALLVLASALVAVSSILRDIRARRGAGAGVLEFAPGTLTWMGMVLVLVGALAEGLGSAPGDTWWSWRNWILFAGVASVLGAAWASGMSPRRVDPTTADDDGDGVVPAAGTPFRRWAMAAALVACVVLGLIPGILLGPLQPRISRSVEAVQMDVMAERNPSTYRALQPRIMDVLREEYERSQHTSPDGLRRASP